MKPNFFIIGAPKCGTTALASYMETNPQIFICSPKEPHYFSTDIDWQTITNRDDYLLLFSRTKNSHRAIGEGSVFYLFSKVAIPNIINFNSNAKFIVMLRNPLELVESLHAENRKSGSEQFDDFEAAWRAQGARLIHPPSRNPNAHQYEAVAKLGEQLERLYSVVDKSRVHVVLFDDFNKNPRTSYQNVLKFLDVDDDQRTVFEKINKKYTYRSIRVNQMITAVSDYFGLSSVAHKPLKYISDVIRQLNYLSPSYPPLRPEFKQELISVFHDDVLLLGRLLDRDLSHWLK